MSITNLLVQGTDEAESWVNLNVNSIKINNNFLPTLPILSGNFADGTAFNNLTYTLNASTFVEDVNIPAYGVSYSGTTISVLKTGLYNVNVNLTFEINTGTTPSTLSLLLSDQTASSDIIGSSKYVASTGQPSTLILNRTVYLQVGHIYELIITNDNNNSCQLSGTNGRSYMSINYI